MATRVEFPLYNVCYYQTDGQVRTLREEVPLKQGLEAMKKFDRMLCCERNQLDGIDYLFLLPVRKWRTTEK